MAKLIEGEELSFLKISNLYRKIRFIDDELSVCKTGSTDAVYRLLRKSANLNGIAILEDVRFRMMTELKRNAIKCNKELVLSIKKIKGAK